MTDSEKMQYIEKHFDLEKFELLLHANYVKTPNTFVQAVGCLMMCIKDA